MVDYRIAGRSIVIVISAAGNNTVQRRGLGLRRQAVDATANNHAAIHIGNYIDGCAAAAAFILIDRLLLRRQPAFINAAPWCRRSRVTGSIDKAFNHQRPANYAINMNTNTVFAAHINGVALAVIAGYLTKYINASRFVPKHADKC